MANNQAIGWRGWLVRGALGLLVLACPLKFGLVTLTDEVSVFPESGWDWVFGVWPPFLAPVLAGVVLLLCVLVYPVPRLARRAWLFPAGWAALTVALLPGLLYTTEWDSALLIFWHWLGVTAFAVAAFWALGNDRRLGGWLLAALSGGTLLAAFSGWQQGPGGGLAEMLRMLNDSGAAKSIDPFMLSRLREGRIFGPFIYPNSFAAHLILTGPVVVWAAWRLGNFFRPERVSRWLLAGSAAVVLGGALWWSGSRGGMLALCVGCGAAMALQPLFRRRRGWVLAGLGVVTVLVLTAGSWKMAKNWQERGDSRSVAGVALASSGARAAYAQTSVRIWREAPVTGVGLGEFGPYYLRYKTAGVEDIRHSHNMVLGVAVQAGILAALAALVCLVLPLFMGTGTGDGKNGELRITNGESPAFVAAVQAGLLAWGLHAMVDFNCEIIGSVMVFALLPALVLAGKATEGEDGSEERAKSAQCATFLGWRLAATGLALVAMVGIWRFPGEMAYARFVAISQNPQVSMEEAVRTAREVSRWLPANPHVSVGMGFRALAAQDFRLAQAAFGMAAKQTPHRASIWSFLAAASLAVGDEAGAVRAAEKAVEWSPTSAVYREQLAKCRAAAGKRQLP